MEDIAFNDWPPVDLGSGANSWLPAYGFQTPSALLERDDFLGSPDADYFLQGNSTQCLYLETIHEETSDDLRSDSDISDIRSSPLGWLATDSETDSVICMDATNETDCESDREIACPIKRRRQDNHLPLPPEDDFQSLSRSSSLIQFETLEKQCQETSSSSPSIYSQFSLDSLDHTKPNTHRTSSEGSDSGDSETTLAPSKSFTNLRTWRSFEGLPHVSASNKRDKISVENLSEDSGYSDHMRDKKPPKSPSFVAYDYCETFGKIGGNFGASCQNLNVVADVWSRATVNLEKTSTSECRAKYKCTSASEPNLVQSHHSTVTNREENISRSCDLSVECACSVPKDLDQDDGGKTSIAAKNWDLADLKLVEMAVFKREGSYAEAMRNRVDLSDDEQGLCFKKKLPKTTIVDFDKKVLQAISESIHSSLNSISVADAHLSNIYNTPPPPTKNKRSVASTPNLVMNPNERERFAGLLLEDERRRSVQDLPRKSSLVNHSTSTSCISDADDKTLNFESGSSKGVHFSPVVSEVNWNDENQSTPSPERESSYSLSSTPERESLDNLTKALLETHQPTPPYQRLSESQPFLNLQHQQPPPPRFRSTFSQSQPDVSRLKRRGSLLLKKDDDGCIIKAYIDRDGVQYKHTHMDLDNANEPIPPLGKSHVSAVRGDVQTKRNDAVVVMEAVGAPRKDFHQQPKTPRAKLGGFFSRLTSFRFSKKDDKKKKTIDKKPDVSLASQHQRVATKDDYIYIPLKGPGGGSGDAAAAAAAVSSSPSIEKNNRESVVAKPPLPRAPPRVVGASVKRGDNAQGRHDHHHQQHRRRRTIDSGESCPRPMEPMGLIETDLDTEVTVITSGPNVKTRSLLDLGAEPRLGTLNDAGREGEGAARPHKSMEFLLDKQNLKVVEPPENELQKGERVMSEHQLRVQRSLQKLTVPEWYKQSQVPREGFLLKKHSREPRWTGTGSKTTSLNSLGQPSPVALSPTSGQAFVRWSTSKLNSTASSPCASTRSSFNTRQPNGSISPSSARSSFSYRQPYMGWRSQERLSKPRTPAERLANTLLARPHESPEIQTSIKEVTSAIVHYVSGLRPESSDEATTGQRSRSSSPRGSQKLCWLESSFVGIRPLDSPQTPVSLTENQAPSAGLRLELQTHNGESLHA